MPIESYSAVKTHFKGVLVMPIFHHIQFLPKLEAFSYNYPVTFNCPCINLQFELLCILVLLIFNLSYTPPYHHSQSRTVGGLTQLHSKWLYVPADLSILCSHEAHSFKAAPQNPNKYFELMGWHRVP